MIICRVPIGVQVYEGKRLSMERQRYPRLRAEDIEGQPVMSDEELKRLEEGNTEDSEVVESDPLDIEEDSNPSPTPALDCQDGRAEIIHGEAQAEGVPKLTPTRKQIQKMTIESLERAIYLLTLKAVEEAEINGKGLNPLEAGCLKLYTDLYLTLKWQKEYEDVIPHDPSMLCPPDSNQRSLIQKLKNQKQNLIKAHRKDGRKSSTPRAMGDGLSLPPY